MMSAFEALKRSLNDGGVSYLFASAKKYDKDGVSEKLGIYLKAIIVFLCTSLEVFIEDGLKELEEKIRKQEVLPNDNIKEAILNRIKNNKDSFLKISSCESDINNLIAWKNEDYKNIRIQLKDADGNKYSSIIDTNLSITKTTMENIQSLFKQIIKFDIKKDIDEELYESINTMIYWRNKVVHRGENISDLTYTKAEEFKNNLLAFAEKITNKVESSLKQPC